MSLFNSIFTNGFCNISNDQEKFKENNINFLSDRSLMKSPLPKPDFSIVDKKESSFSYKQDGSYKKPKNYVPESPMKSPNQKAFTPGSMQKNSGQLSTNFSKRKLDFSTMASAENGISSPIKEESPERNQKSFGRNLNSLISNIDLQDVVMDEEPISCKQNKL